MRRKASSQEDEAAIDMTPMLDIVFIMLIFFIVTTEEVAHFNVFCFFFDLIFNYSGS